MPSIYNIHHYIHVLYQQLEFTCNPVGLLSLLPGKKVHIIHHIGIIFGIVLFIHELLFVKSPQIQNVWFVQLISQFLLWVGWFILQSSGDSSSDDSASSGKEGVDPINFSILPLSPGGDTPDALTIFLFPLETLLGAGNRTHQTLSYRRWLIII